MRNCLVSTLCLFVVLVITGMTVRCISVSFKANRISKELYKNLDRIYERNGMVVNISDCLETQWDSIYVLGHHCDSLVLDSVMPPQYGIKGNSYRNSMVVLRSGKAIYVDYILRDGFASPPVQFYIPDREDSYLITPEDDFLVWEEDGHYVLFPAKECLTENNQFFVSNLNLANDDRLFLEKLSVFLDGEIDLKDLFK